MDMADGSVEFDTKIDGSGIDKGLKEIARKIMEFAKSPSLAKLGSMGTMISGAKDAFDLVTGAIGKAYGAVKELSDAANKQSDAEARLAVAAKNNPYLDDYAVSKLKSFAGELQGIGEIGDEELLPMMANLAASGRSYEEIQGIMSAALEASATGMVDMNSAVKALNQSYSGSVGELGNLLPSLKNLSEEELRSGKAIEAVKNAYGGMSEATANAGVQLANSWGDLKEKLGGLLNKVITPLQKGLLVAADAANALWDKLANILSGGDGPQATTLDGRLMKARDELSELKKLLEEAKSAGYGDEQSKALETALDAQTDKIAAAERRRAKILEKAKETFQCSAKEAEKYAAVALKEVDNEIAQLSRANVVGALKEQKKARDDETGAIMRQIDAKEKEIAALEKEMEARRKAADTRARREANDRKVADAWAAYEAEINAKKAELVARNQALEAIGKERMTDSEQNEEMLATMQSAYVRFWQAVGELGRTRSEKIRADMREVALGIIGDTKKSTKQLEKIQADVQSYYKESAEETRAALEAELDFLRKLKDESGKFAVIDGEKVAAGTEKFEELEKAIRGVGDALSALDEGGDGIFSEQFLSKLETAQTALSNFTSAVSTFSQAACDAWEDEKNSRLASLEEENRKGLLSEKQYEEKKDEIKKKAADKQYKMQMAEWGMKIAQITLDTAVATMKAYASAPGPLGVVLAASSAALGSAQLAAAIAAKPVPPSFSTGGIVGGSSYYGDNIAANLNSREMVMNMGQQKELWDFINGGSRGAGGANIVINNSASNIVTARPEITKDKIELLIDARVNEGLRSGRYGTSLGIAQSGMSGNFYGI